jgi:hypothetical protein
VSSSGNINTVERCIVGLLRKKQKRETHKKLSLLQKIRYANIFIGGAAVKTKEKNLSCDGTAAILYTAQRKGGHR